MPTKAKGKGGATGRGGGAGAAGAGAGGGGAVGGNQLNVANAAPPIDGVRRLTIDDAADADVAAAGLGDTGAIAAITT